MATATQSVDLNTVYTAHAHLYLNSEPQDQFYRVTPTLAMLRAHKRTEKGGNYLVVSLLEGHESVGGAYSRAETVSMTAKDVVTRATYEWAFYEEPIVIYHQDEMRASGSEAKFGLVEQQMRAARLRLARKLSSDLYATAPAAKALQGIPLAIPADPTASVAYGGLNGSAGNQTWWRNQTATSAGAFATNGLPKMRTLFNDIWKGNPGLAPDWIVMSQTGYENYESLVSTHHEVQSQATSKMKLAGDLGFEHLGFKGVPLMWDPDIDSSGKVYMGNNEAIQLVCMEGGEFTIFPFMSSTGSGLAARSTMLRWEGQVATYERRRLGQISGFTY